MLLFVNQSMILIVCSLHVGLVTVNIILHRIDRISLHNTKYQIVIKLGKQNQLHLQYFMKTVKTGS